MIKRHTLLDSIFFPYRALFPGGGGLSSLRDERFYMVAKHISGKVLDVGCGPGNLFIKNFAPHNSIGIDFYAYDGIENVISDPSKLPFDDASFDTVTLIAVVSHIPKRLREAEFFEFARVLREGGLLIATEGEPISQYLVHKWRAATYKYFGTSDMDSERGMDEEEEYCMPRKELLGYLNSNSLKLIKRERFMWGLNNIYIAQKIHMVV